MLESSYTNISAITKFMPWFVTFGGPFGWVEGKTSQQLADFRVIFIKLLLNYKLLLSVACRLAIIPLISTEQV
jgi:hypothetical protein